MTKRGKKKKKRNRNHKCDYSGITKVPHICDQDGVKINLMGPEVPREKNTLSETPFLWFLGFTLT